MRILPLCILFPTLLLSLPVEHHLIQGTAHIEQNEDALTVTASDRTILNWRDFSIEKNETARFVLPNSHSSILNRVEDAYPSRLLGNLLSNGRVLLINPNGVLVGADAQIDTGAFLASSLDVLDHAFLAGNELSFIGPSDASIVNLGHIKGSEGEIFLIGRHIENHGAIDAKEEIGAIAASTVVLKPKDFSGISIRTDGYTSDTDNFFSYAFHRNQIDQTNAVHTGSLSSPGGNIYILGQNIEIGDGAQVSTSAPFQGGHVFIGGDVHGENFANAARTYSSPSSQISANATDRGNGGKIVLWGDEANWFYGNLSAKGGPNGGNGGLVEVSSPNFLIFEGIVSTEAPLGETGTLLLDPTNLTIGAASNAQVTTTPAGPLFTLAVPNAVGATLGAGALATALGSNNVTVTTVGSGGMQNGDITVSNAVNWASGNSLTLNAAGNLLFNASVQNAGTGALIMTAGGNLVQINTTLGATRVSVGSRDGLTSLDAPSATVNLQSGNVNLRPAQLGFYTPDGVTATGPITIVNCAQLNLNGGPVPPAAQVGGAQIGHGRIDDNTAVTAATGPGANINVTCAGTINLNPATTRPACIGHGSGDTIAGADQAGNITVTSTGGNIVINAAAGVASTSGRIGHGGTRSSMGTSAQGNITVTAPSTAVGQGSITLNSVGTMAGQKFLAIGHGTTTGGGTNYTTLQGDILVACGNSLTLSLGFGTCDISVGHMSQTTTVGYNANIRAIAGQDITLTDTTHVTTSSNIQIGLGFTLDNMVNETTLVAGRDVIVNTAGLAGALLIGQNGDTAASTTSVNVAAGRDVTVTQMGGTAFIKSGGNVSVAAGQDILLTTSTNNGAAIGTTNRLTAANAVSRIYATRDIQATSLLAGNAFIGQVSVLAQGFSVDLRAGGDIQLATNLGNTGTGTIFVQADSNFGASQLWGYSGGNLTSIATNILGTPMTNTAVLAGKPTAAPSAAINALGDGAFRIVTGPAIPNNHISFTTISGDITLNSADTRRIGGLQNLFIGPANPPTPTLSIVTNSGNIRITGSVSSDAFNNIFWNGTTSTSGSILAIANVDQTLTAATITSSASFVTLVVDNAFPVRPFVGPGIFVMDGASGINAPVSIKIYTAIQENGTLNNQINPLARFNGVPISLAALPYPGTFFVDTSQERWCIYYPEFIPGIPFTISYKYCLPIIAHQADIIIDQMLVNLHPYNEFPGWAEEFFLSYSEQDPVMSFKDPYLIRRRHLHSLNHPKTWTHLLSDWRFQAD